MHVPGIIASQISHCGYDSEDYITILQQYETQLKGKRILLVDDGIATGTTILSAAQWLKTKQNSQELIIAVPVGPHDTVTKRTITSTK